jgi:pimeloyl-ACP methyl ester carboxylesterase
MTSTLTSRYFQVDGRAVHYRHKGHGEPVVLLHASPRSSLAMLPMMNTAPDGLALFAIDLPGLGRSAPLFPPSAESSPESTSIQPFADALAATLTALGLPRVRLYGTHTGAAVAVAFAVRYPERVERLVLDALGVFPEMRQIDLAHDVDSYLPPLEPDPDGLHMTWAWNRMRDQALFFPWNVRRTDARMWRPMPSPDRLQGAVLDLLVAGDYRSAYAAALRTDGRAWVAELRVPTRVGARGNDVLRSHLELLGTVPPCVTVAPFANDAPTWAPQVWAALQGGAALPVAPTPVDQPWSGPLITDCHRGPAGARLHWRGCAEGSGRPLVLLHDSPGSARMLDARLAMWAGQRPVFACDLPGHGESDRAPGNDVVELLDVLEAGLERLDLADAELRGIGAGSWLAHWLALRRPQHWSVATPLPHRGPMPPPSYAATRADGGHLNQAWLDARDAAILGPWWQRDPRDCHDFGDTLDWRAIHREAVERLFETPAAADLRRSIAEKAVDVGRGLTSPSASRTPTLPRTRSVDRTP